MSLTLGWIHPFLVSLLALSTFPHSSPPLTFPLPLGTFFAPIPHPQLLFPLSTRPLPQSIPPSPLLHILFTVSLSSLHPSFHPKPLSLSPPHWTLFSAIQYSIHSCHPIRPPLYSSHIIFSTPLPPPLPAQFSSPPSPRPCLQ